MHTYTHNLTQTQPNTQQTKHTNTHSWAHKLIISCCYDKVLIGKAYMSFISLSDQMKYRNYWQKETFHDWYACTSMNEFMGPSNLYHQGTKRNIVVTIEKEHFITCLYVQVWMN